MAGHRGAAALPLPTLQAGGGRLKPRRRWGLGFRLGVVAPPSPPSFCQFPPSSQPRKLYCPDGVLSHKISLYGFISLCHCVCRVCVWLALCRLSCVCVFVRRCAIGYVVCERSQMYFFFFFCESFAGLRPEPRWGQRPQTPELGPSGPKTSS